MRIRVGIGLASLPFDDRRDWWRFAERCERGGVDSLWQTDRLVSKEPYLEALSAMAALAGATERIKFGMNAVVVGLRDPLALAKACASIDWLSGGRLLPVFGVGGAEAPEWAATGRDPARRGRQANEALELLARLWSQERVDFDGEFYRYRGAQIAPRPLQQPLPLWIGGASAAAVRRTARLGTGWLGGVSSPAEVGRTIRAIRAECERIGRRIDDDHYGATVPFRIGGDDDPLVARLRAASGDGGSVVVGDARAVVARVAAFAREGASKFVLLPLARGAAELERHLQVALEEVIPEAERAGFPAAAR